MSRRKRHNPEKRLWRGRSYKKDDCHDITVQDLKQADKKEDERPEESEQW